MKTKRTPILAAMALVAMSSAGLMASEMSDADMKVWREAVDERLKGLENFDVDANKIRIEAFSNIRFDDVRNLTNTAGSSSGIYNRRSEMKFHGLLTPGVTYSLGFDFADAKLKDLGLEIKDLPLIPFVESGQTWTMRLGQYRIPFGMVPQISSSRTNLPERPYIYGGSGQLGASRMVGERVMGIQGRHQAKLGIIDTDIQAAGVNNASQDAARNLGAGQTATSLAAQYSNQVTDNDLSWVGRASWRWNFIEKLLPERSRLTTGASYIRDSKNTVYMAQLASQQRYDEIYGFEARLNLGRNILIESEWVKLMDIRANTGLSGQREGWYVDTVVNILPWIASDIASGDKLDLIFRIEDHLTLAANTGTTRSRIGGGVKWSYWGGSNHTSINYLVEGYNQNFGQAHHINPPHNHTGGAFTTFIVQQQFAFANGRPKWMEKEGE